MLSKFKPEFTREEKYLIASLNTPQKIAKYIHEELKYDNQDDYHEHLLLDRSFRRVVRDKKAHCLDGAIFSAAVMREHGHTPYIVCLDAFRDHSHNIMVYRDKNNGKIGSLALSRDQNLWERKPAYKNLYELILSYYHVYTEYPENMDSIKSSEMNDVFFTLRGYSQLIDLNDYLKKDIDWITGEKSLDIIENDFYNVTYKTIFPVGNSIYYKSPDGIKTKWTKKPKDALFELPKNKQNKKTKIIHYSP